MRLNNLFSKKFIWKTEWPSASASRTFACVTRPSHRARALVLVISRRRAWAKFTWHDRSFKSLCNLHSNYFSFLFLRFASLLTYLLTYLSSCFFMFSSLSYRSASPRKASTSERSIENFSWWVRRDTELHIIYNVFGSVSICRLCKCM